MPQWRKLHVKAVESFDINDMPDDFTRLLWVMLPLKLDSDGRGIDDSSWIRSQVMPMRADITLEMVSAAMDWYAQRRMIERYKVNGRSYFWVPTFAQYQGNTKREADSHLPAPNSDDNRDKVVTNSRPTQDQSKQESVTDSDVDSDSNTDTPTEASAPSPPKKRKAKPKTETPPAVKTFRSATHRYPAKAWYSDIDQVVGRDPPNLEFWYDVVKAYVGVGWNPTNVKNMLEFYQRREIPGDGKENGAKNAQSTAHPQQLTEHQKRIAEAFESNPRNPGG